MVLAALPGRAQEGSDGRYAFRADSTLLRDTLGLRFPRLFPLSDSLEVPADTLRALSVRYLWSLERLVFLADSLGIPVDSVGPHLVRERFSTLAGTRGRRTEFSYNSAYNVGLDQSGWRNTGEYGLTAGSVFVKNSTSVQIDRSGSGTSLYHNRQSTTEAGWRFSPDFRLGGRVIVERLDNRYPAGSLRTAKNEYQFSMQSRQDLAKGLTSTLNANGGLLDEQRQSNEGRGLSGSVNSRIRYVVGSWLTQELNGTVDGTQSSASRNVRGSLALFQSSWVSLKGNFNYRHARVVTVDDTGFVRRNLTDQSGGDGTLRLRQDNDRYVDVTTKLSTSKLPPSRPRGARSTRQDDGFNMAARYLVWGWSFDGRFSNSFSDSRFPNVTDTSGYSQLVHARSLDGTLNRQIARRINLQLSASIALTSTRSSAIGRYPTLNNKDDLRQSWRAKTSYNPSGRFNTSLAVDVGKTREINLLSASTGTNNGRRTYRSDWNWTYRLFPSLTAVQTNSLGATYTDYTFFPENNRLNLDFTSVTTLSAVVTPRLSISVTHNTRRAPSGNYTLYPDDLYYFQRADEDRTASLRASIDYNPTPAFQLSFRPTYFATDGSSALNGVEVPKSSRRALDFAGGANINYPIGSKGVLRGDISRTTHSDRTTSYSSGLPQPSPSTRYGYWNGSLQLSWHL